MTFRHLLRQAGFTMIELLVVIAVIGVLAVAVLSSINPIEQINKGRDTRTRSDAAQLINAVDRYYATQEKYPWNDELYACGLGAASCPLTVAQEDPSAEFPTDFPVGVCDPVDTGTAGEGTCQLDPTNGAWMDGLTDTSEVKDAFVSRIQAQTTYAIYAYKATSSDSSMQACFRPSSKAFQKEALDDCRDVNVAGSWDTLLQGAACPNGAVGATYTQSANADELICLP